MGTDPKLWLIQLWCNMKLWIYASKHLHDTANVECCKTEWRWNTVILLWSGSVMLMEPWKIWTQFLFQAFQGDVVIICCSSWADGQKFFSAQIHVSTLKMKSWL